MSSNTKEAASQVRDETINIRVKPSQLELIDMAAKAQGKSRSSFMLETASREAEAVLLDRCFFQVDSEQFSQFMAVLDTPPAKNEKLRKLLTTKAMWD